MVDMHERFGGKVGLSNHTMGVLVPTAAVSLEAKVVEKHFILDRSLGGPDSAFSMEPDEFAEMVSAIRNTEKVLGRVTYEVSESDKMRRRSLFVTEDIKAGEMITEKNVRSIRPGFGIHPKYYKEIKGKKAVFDISKGTALSFDLLNK